MGRVIGIVLVVLGVGLLPALGYLFWYAAQFTGHIAFGLRTLPLYPGIPIMIAFVGVVLLLKRGSAA